MQPIFAVHQRLANLLWFRLIGAAMTLGICWKLIQSYGIFGAAAGACVAPDLYVVTLVFAPGGYAGGWPWARVGKSDAARGDGAVEWLTGR